MSKAAKSQWDFGELFEPSKLRKVHTVSELTQKVRTTLENQVGQVWVTGEITNLRAQSSGHYYFSVKDAGAQLGCVLFSREKAVQRDLLADGVKVVLQGEITVYEARGQYQLIVRSVELQGLGSLQAAFEKLKQKLAGEGLFDQARKRPLPPYPRRIGVVTSPTGAALRDVLHAIQRRHASLEIIIAPVRVQGQGAAAEIAEAIRMLNAFNAQPHLSPDHSNHLDLILVTRGGGSLEDLWAFNEEPVARAIFESALPVVSAVGHEIDFTIADFVADFRAATPSAAAEIITQAFVASHDFVATAPLRMLKCARRGLAGSLQLLDEFNSRLARMHPRRRLELGRQRLDELKSSLLRQVKTTAQIRRQHLTHLEGRFFRVRPSVRLNRLRDSLRQVERQLQALGPQQVLSRGYSITMDAQTGKIIRSHASLKPGQTLKTKLSNGQLISTLDRAEG